MERVTIIGGTGFVGDYLVKRLIKNPELSLKIIYRKTLPTIVQKNVEYLKIDSALEPDKFKTVLEQTDYLIILSRPDKRLIQNIIQSGFKFKKVLYTSTILIYPNSNMRQFENAELVPANDYEKEKIEEEKMLCDYAKASGSKLIIARLTNVYGDIKNRALVHWIFKALINKSAFKLNNRGEPIRDFIFVEDAARYLEVLLFLKQKAEVEIFNVCSGEGFSINQVLEIVEEISGEKIKIDQGLVTDEKLSVIGDNSKVIMVTGVSPEYNLRSGLEKTYQNYLK